MSKEQQLQSLLQEQVIECVRNNVKDTTCFSLTIPKELFRKINYNNSVDDMHLWRASHDLGLDVTYNKFEKFVFVHTLSQEPFRELGFVRATLPSATAKIDNDEDEKSYDSSDDSDDFEMVQKNDKKDEKIEKVKIEQVVEDAARQKVFDAVRKYEHAANEAQCGDDIFFLVPEKEVDEWVKALKLKEAKEINEVLRAEKINVTGFFFSAHIKTSVSERYAWFHYIDGKGVKDTHTVKRFYNVTAPEVCLRENMQYVGDRDEWFFFVPNETVRSFEKYCVMDTLCEKLGLRRTDGVYFKYTLFYNKDGVPFATKEVDNAEDKRVRAQIQWYIDEAKKCPSSFSFLVPHDVVTRWEKSKVYAAMAKEYNFSNYVNVAFSEDETNDTTESYALVYTNDLMPWRLWTQEPMYMGFKAQDSWHDALKFNVKWVAERSDKTFAFAVCEKHLGGKTPNTCDFFDALKILKLKHEHVSCSGQNVHVFYDRHGVPFAARAKDVVLAENRQMESNEEEVIAEIRALMAASKNVSNDEFFIVRSTKVDEWMHKLKMDGKRMTFLAFVEEKLNLSGTTCSSFIMPKTHTENFAWFTLRNTKKHDFQYGVADSKKENAEEYLRAHMEKCGKDGWWYFAVSKEYTQHLPQETLCKRLGLERTNSVLVDYTLFYDAKAQPFAPRSEALRGEASEAVKTSGASELHKLLNKYISDALLIDESCYTFTVPSVEMVKCMQSRENLNQVCAELDLKWLTICDGAFYLFSSSEPLVWTKLGDFDLVNYLHMCINRVAYTSDLAFSFTLDPNNRIKYFSESEIQAACDTLEMSWKKLENGDYFFWDDGQVPFKQRPDENESVRESESGGKTFSDSLRAHTKIVLQYQKLQFKTLVKQKCEEALKNGKHEAIVPRTDAVPPNKVLEVAKELGLQVRLQATSSYVFQWYTADEFNQLLKTF